ncbi:MAG: hypothetical protein ACLS4Y_06455, partial [Faecalibacterium sp.]
AGGYGNGYSAGSRSGYLNREYNAGESRGFGSAYANRGSSRRLWFRLRPQWWKHWLWCGLWFSIWLWKLQRCNAEKS